MLHLAISGYDFSDPTICEADYGSQDQEGRCHRSFRWRENTRSTHRRGLSQTELGNKLGITFQQIQKYEKGSNRVSAGRLKQIAETLEVPVSFFFEGASGKDTLAENINEGLSFLETAASVRLVRAFAEIENQNIRSSIVALVEGIARGHSGRRT